ncbi:MAG: arginine--tRNA ligase [Cyclonatronaceae bacterium]
MKEYLEKIIISALREMTSLEDLPPVIIENPRVPEHGDAATNIAMVLAKPLRKPPRAIAEELVKTIKTDPSRIAAIEIAGPGFINFRFANNWLYEELSELLGNPENYGRSAINAGKRFQVEFVSANPTGPLTVGHGRNAVLGDTVARLFEWTGASVDREYYFNNAGRQMRVLGESVRSRYLQLIGKDAALSDEGYQGEYIVEIARQLADERGDSLADTADVGPFQKIAEEQIFEDIKNTLGRMNIRMDTFFNERDLYENGDIDRVLGQLREKGLVYDEDGATWFKTTEFGKEKDTVLVKSSGEPTYRLPDIAYHANKLDRGYDLVIDIFGADHIATYPDVLSGIESLGYDTSKVSVLVYQFVTIVKDGKPYKMSTRKANFVTLDELMDEVGADVTRFFFLMRSPGTHLEFDIAQAREAGEKNPVFYLQYAHARIKSIMRKANEVYPQEAAPELSLLTHEAEIAVIKRLLGFGDAVAAAALHMEPHRLITYLNELAAGFHRFYHDCRIMGEEKPLAEARIALLNAVTLVLANGLGILGIEAPDSM